MPILFADNSVKSKLRDKLKLKQFISAAVLKQVKKEISLQYVFVSDAYLLAMNQSFLKHNTFTDIITFDLSENNKKIIGEIYISVERVTQNAEKFKVSYFQELHRVIFHGVLHLCGFKDKKKEDIALMRKKEEQWLKDYAKNFNVTF